MADDQDSPEEPATTPEPQASQRRPIGMSWQSLIDQKIRQAQERGEFDNLPGAGKPQILDENPYAGDRAMAFHFLKSHGMAPREIELGREIDHLLAQAEKLLQELQRQREGLAHKRVVFPRDNRGYMAARQRILNHYTTLLNEARSKILSLNISAPMPLHRQLIDVDARLRDFAARFPPLTN